MAHNRIRSKGRLVDLICSPVCGLISFFQSDEPTDTNNVRKRAPRYKTRYTPSQIQHLERCYLKSRWLNSNRKKEIAEQTGLQRCQVQSWFQNRLVIFHLIEGVHWLRVFHIRIAGEKKK